MNYKNLIAGVAIFASSNCLSIGQTVRFGSDGLLKIVQFTDTHIAYGNPETQTALKVVEETIDSENPDLIIFTGDVVTEKPEAEGWRTLMSLLETKKIPFVILTGNHDNEQGITYKEIADIVKENPYTLNFTDAAGKLADMALEVKESDGDRTAAVLYCMDSNTYSKLDKVGGYGWLSQTQIAWYRSTSEKYKEGNNGKPVPSMAFFHIPLPEYNTAFFKEGANRAGIRLEQECPAEVNSGMFTAMLEQDDIMGVFTGHDHNNDYVASLYGISLGYGRFSGGKTTYIDLMPGARIITMYEDEERFTTYLRLADGRKIGHYASDACPDRDITFAVAADLHFDLLPETDQYYHVRAMNRLENNFIWNSSTPAFSGDTVKKLDAVVIAGDIFDKALPETHSLYKERYTSGTGDKTVKYPVYPGYGNHDIDPISKKPAENLKARKMNLDYMDSVLEDKLEKGEILSYDPESRCYSWNIGDVHFVQMHTYAGDDHYCKGNSLEWLEKDLQRYAAGNTPVVYIQHYGFDEWAIKWWPQDKREKLFDILDQYRVVGFFVGHTHNPSIETYRGYRIYQVNNAWPDEDGNGAFAVARMKGDTFEVASCRWTDGNGNFEVTGPYLQSHEDRSNWMEGMEDDTRLCKISIPATHDSGSLLGGEALQTQDITIEQQLEKGIRGFDIRLQAIEGDRLGIFHSTQFQNQTWEEDVLPAFINFLKENPSETLVVSLKKEGGSSEDYRRLLSASLSQKENRKYFVHKFKEDLTLGECRGKILFLHRNKAMEDYPGALCSNWGDNTTCDVTLTGSNGKQAIASVQDEYQYKNEKDAPYKTATTMKNIARSMAEPENSDKWFISFASATALPADGPEAFSDKVNPALAQEIQGLDAAAGIIMIDFAGDKYGSQLIEEIIKSNF